MARSPYRNKRLRGDSGRLPHGQAMRHRRLLAAKGKGVLHLPGGFRTGACIYQIDELPENAPGEKTVSYMPPVAQKRAFPNKMHSVPNSGKH